MNVKLRWAVLAVVLTALSCSPSESGTGPQAGSAADSAAAAGGTYDDLVALFEEFRAFERQNPADGVPDYSPANMERRHAEIRGFQDRLQTLAIGTWPTPEQIDYHLVRAEMNGVEFFYRVLRPWETSPYWYWGSSTSTSLPYHAFSDRPAVPEGPGWGELGFAAQPDFPLSPEEVEAYGRRLRALPRILAQGKANIAIAEAKRDMGLITIRATVEEGNLLEGMVALMEEHHPELAGDAREAWEAVQDYRAWIEDNLDAMAAPTGVGVENFNWWLKNVFLIPYTWDEAWTLARREFERGLASLKLEEHRNRGLPRLQPAATRDEYLYRHREAEDALREFLLSGAFMTVSVEEIDAAYAAYPPRPPASPPAHPRNFLAGIIHEHLGHQLDAIRPETGLSPIRASRRLHEMTHSRREGVADGMIEALMLAGINDDQPRLRELVFIGTANRGAIGIAELLFQANELDYAGWNQYETDNSIYGSIVADDSEWWNAGVNYNRWDHKKDAVRAPGYEVAYSVGVIQFQKLMADRAAQLGEEFEMRAFMDEFFAAGQMPTALIRWQLTGLTDEMEKLLE